MAQFPSAALGRAPPVRSRFADLRAADDGLSTDPQRRQRPFEARRAVDDDRLRRRRSAPLAAAVSGARQVGALQRLFAAAATGSADVMLDFSLTIRRGHLSRQPGPPN
jgi:hypothetical protein